jgi:hypothetical protein
MDFSGGKWCEASLDGGCGLVGICLRLGGFEVAGVVGDGGDVLVLHGELPSAGGVEAEEGDGGLLAGEEPIVGLHDDERKLVEEGGVGVEEIFLGAFDVDFEEEGGVEGGGLGGEEGGHGEHGDLWTLLGGVGAVGEGAFAGVGEVGDAVGWGYTGLAEVDVVVAAVALEEGEVVGGGLDGEDVGMGVAGEEPEDAGADVGAAVYDEGFAAGGDDVLVDTVDVGAVGPAGHVVLGLLEALGDDLTVGVGAPVDDGDGFAETGGAGELEIGGDLGVVQATGEQDDLARCAVEESTEGRSAKCFDSIRLETHWGSEWSRGPRAWC